MPRELWRATAAAKRRTLNFMEFASDGVALNEGNVAVRT